MFVFMPLFGINQGATPIAGYNYGAKLYKRVSRVLFIAIIFATVVMITGFVVVQLFPRTIASFFTDDVNLINLTVEGLRYVFICFPIIGFQMVASTFFQSIGKAKKAIFLSLTRQVIFLIPFLIILPNFWGIIGIWLSLPLSDLFSTILTLILLIAQFKKLKS